MRSLDDGIDRSEAVDLDQLNWLQDGLIESWRNPSARGRVLVFHNPLSISEVSKWDQGQTLAVRHHLRGVLDAVASTLGEARPGRPLVDLVHTGHGDCHIPWVVCRGSGYSLRRQRRQGVDLLERCAPSGECLVARRHCSLVREGIRVGRFYSALRVDVPAGQPFTISCTSLVCEWVGSGWDLPQLSPVIGSQAASGSWN